MIQLKGITSAHVQRLIGLPLRIMFLTLQYLVHEYVAKNLIPYYRLKYEVGDDDDEFRFNDASTHEGHLRQNGELTWFCSETNIMISHKCIKCKTRTNLKIKTVILF